MGYVLVLFFQVLFIVVFPVAAGGVFSLGGLCCFMVGCIVVAFVFGYAGFGYGFVCGFDR